MNNGRDCAHGRQVGKCDTCDLIDAEQRILELEAQVEQLNALIIKMQERATLFLQPDGESESEFVNFIIGIFDGPEHV